MLAPQRVGASSYGISWIRRSNFHGGLNFNMSPFLELFNGVRQKKLTLFLILKT